MTTVNESTVAKLKKQLKVLEDNLCMFKQIIKEEELHHVNVGELEIELHRLISYIHDEEDMEAELCLS